MEKTRFTYEFIRPIVIFESFSYIVIENVCVYGVTCTVLIVMKTPFIVASLYCFNQIHIYTQNTITLNNVFVNALGKKNININFISIMNLVLLSSRLRFKPGQPIKCRQVFVVFFFKRLTIFSLPIVVLLQGLHPSFAGTV